MEYGSFVKPNLDGDAERSLIRAAQAGDVEARDALLASNMRFMMKAAKSKKYFSFDEEDLLGYMVIAFIKAIATFDLERFHCLRTHAYYQFQKALNYPRRRQNLVKYCPQKMSDNLSQVQAKVPETPDFDEIEIIRNTLTERELSVVTMRFHDKLTLKEIGLRLGPVSRERARQIVQGIVRKLSKAFGRKISDDQLQ